MLLLRLLYFYLQSVHAKEHTEYYEKLGISRSATNKEVRKAFKVHICCFPNFYLLINIFEVGIFFTNENTAFLTPDFLKNLMSESYSTFHVKEKLKRIMKDYFLIK